METCAGFMVSRDCHGFSVYFTLRLCPSSGSDSWKIILDSSVDGDCVREELPFPEDSTVTLAPIGWLIELLRDSEARGGPFKAEGGRNIDKAVNAAMDYMSLFDTEGDLFGILSGFTGSEIRAETPMLTRGFNYGVHGKDTAMREYADAISEMSRKFGAPEVSGDKDLHASSLDVRGA